MQNIVAQCPQCENFCAVPNSAEEWRCPKCGEKWRSAKTKLRNQTSLMLEENVTDEQFSDCGRLRSVRFTQQVTEIGSMAFRGCRVLEKIFFRMALNASGALRFPNAMESVGLCCRAIFMKLAQGFSHFPKSCSAWFGRRNSIQSEKRPLQAVHRLQKLCGRRHWKRSVRMHFWPMGSRS